MELWAELFSDWVGILSFSVIAFVLVMGVYYMWFFLKHVEDEEKNIKH